MSEASKRWLTVQNCYVSSLKDIPSCKLVRLSKYFFNLYKLQRAADSLIVILTLLSSISLTTDLIAMSSCLLYQQRDVPF